MGLDSEFAYLHNNKAKQLFIGDKESFWHTKAYTSVHYIEEKVKVKYLLYIFFFLPVLLVSKTYKEIPFTIFINNLVILS